MRCKTLILYVKISRSDQSADKLWCSRLLHIRKTSLYTQHLITSDQHLTSTQLPGRPLNFPLSSTTSWWLLMDTPHTNWSLKNPGTLIMPSDWLDWIFNLLRNPVDRNIQSWVSLHYHHSYSNVCKVIFPNNWERKFSMWTPGDRTASLSWQSMHWMRQCCCGHISSQSFPLMLPQILAFSYCGPQDRTYSKFRLSKHETEQKQMIVEKSSANGLSDLMNSLLCLPACACS